ncbi:hypothetical protein T459_18544 [Capsicum annuum]|uniref:RING-type E3 ubiquitin transferase n=1 Tax=Capsicum annuum TaxID=4072 RepID=A0A2G2ZES6_CAPAN|nr:hypothetical protein T459_18544 [Capsicum annuum]
MVPWGGVSCCLSATALYLLGRSSGRDAEVLNSVTRVNQLKDLAQLLDTASKVLPLVVTISGRVGSDTPINCEYSGLRGVIVEETAEQHFLKHNDAGSWIQDSALMLSMCKEVPWYLDDGTGRTFVVGGRGATGLVLTVGSEVFEEAGRSFVRGALDYLQGLKMLGVKRIERVLPVGTPLTIVGEAVKADIGTVRIQRPHKGPFYISPKTIDQLIANFGRWASKNCSSSSHISDLLLQVQPDQMGGVLPVRESPLGGIVMVSAYHKSVRESPLGGIVMVSAYHMCKRMLKRAVSILKMA